MSRNPWVLGAIVAFGVYAPTIPACGDIPDPNLNTVPDMLTITPDGSFAYTIMIRNFKGHPISGAIIELDFSPEADTLIAWPPGEPHPVLSGVSDVDGVATFYVFGAGCINWSRFSGSSYIFQVRADGIVLAEPEVNSPDAVSSSGKLPTVLGTNICDGGSTEVGLSDAVFHTAPIKLGLSEPCSNFTGPDFNDPVSLGDAVIATAYITAGTSTACQ